MSAGHTNVVWGGVELVVTDVVGVDVVDVVVDVVVVVGVVVVVVVDGANTPTGT